MWKSVFLFLILALIAGAAAWLADRPGAITLQWDIWRIETSPGVAVLAAVVLVALTIVGYRVWRIFIAGPKALAARRRDARREKGYQALSRGLVAVAAGDGAEAKKLAKRTATLLDDPPLTLLLSAQAAQLDGDEAEARRQFEAMREDGDTEFLGLRGLLVQARRDGDDEQALALARRAYELRPDTRWVVAECFALESAQGQWDKARAIAQRARKQQLLPDGDTAARYLAVCDLGAALAAEGAGNNREALNLARRALSQAPDLTPGLATAARLWGATGEPRKARRLLEKNWRLSPHPELAAAYLAISDGNTPAEQLAALKKLTASAAEHEEGRLALARAALNAGEYGEAETLLSAILAHNPERRALRMMADLTEARSAAGDDARIWLRRAATAPEEAAWTCEVCHHRAAAWNAHCGDCGTFDGLRWQHPAEPANGTEARLALTDNPSGGTAAAAAAAERQDSKPARAADTAKSAGAADDGIPDIEILPPQTGALAAAEAAAGEIGDKGDTGSFVDQDGFVRDPGGRPQT